MSKKFRPLPVGHSVRRQRVDLAADGITATFDEVILPEFWKSALDIQVGDEIEVVSPNWVRNVRINSVGPEGAAVEHISGQQSEPVARHLFVCRVGPDAPHMFTLLEREGVAPDFRCTRLMPGQSNIALLVREAIERLSRDPRLDLTITVREVDAVQEGSPGDDDPLHPVWKDTITFCLEDADSPLRERWNSFQRQGQSSGGRIYSGGPSGRFHTEGLGEHILNWFGANRAFGNGEPEWKEFEKASWRRGDLRVRPRLSARAICPDAFPQRPAVPEEVERVAAYRREVLRISMNPKDRREAIQAGQQAALEEIQAMTEAKARAKAETEAGGGTT
jgi:hypothetical protein